LRYFQSRRWFPFTPETIETASQRFAAYGHWSLLLSWVPVIGDPLTLIAGLLRVPVRRFLVLVATGKAARYVALAAITS
jgi:membrane protein YqaA with SNARE-associated domain